MRKLSEAIEDSVQNDYSSSLKKVSICSGFPPGNEPFVKKLLTLLFDMC